MRRLVPPLVLLLLLVAGQATATPRPGFGWPLPGTPTVDRGFQPPASAWGAGHRGVDVRGYPGEPVLAAGPGRVTYAGLLAGRGVVTVTHRDGLRTTYEPVIATVRVGQQVARGSTLGTLDSGHASCRPGTTCLHWGLLRGDTYLDPLGLLLDQRVRLLPLGTAASPAVSPAVSPAASPVPALRSADAGGRRGGAGGQPVGTLAAAGSLALGLTLLASRRRPAPQPPPRPVDLLAERARRRAA
jgi:murein DD-endopeptidase MepM/ murein hydrolase activator NlpD